MMEVIISIFLGCDLAMNNQEKLNVQKVQTLGASWNTPVNVDGIDNENENEFRASPVIEANDDRVVVFWVETNSAVVLQPIKTLFIQSVTMMEQAGQIL